MEALRHRQRGSPTSSGTPCRTTRCSTAPRTGELEHAAKASSGRAPDARRSRAQTALDEFVSQWLRFDRVLDRRARAPHVPPVQPRAVPRMTEEPAASSATWSGTTATSWTLFTANYSFVNSDLAAIYKVTAAGPRIRSRRVSRRIGARRPLGQTLFLTLTSKPDDTAPTARGLFVREQFLCQQVPPPPPGVNTNLPPVDEAKPVTNRERLAEHATNPSCASCHNLIDPIGFGLEKFDAIGVRREKLKLLFYPDVHEAKIAERRPSKLDLDITGRMSPACRIPSSQLPRSWARCWPKTRAVPGVHREAVFPLHGRPPRHAGGRAADPPGAGRFPAVQFPVSKS